MRVSTTLILSSAAIFAATAAAAQPTVMVTPRGNPPSTSTTVSGTDFGANEFVDIYFDTTDEALAVTNASGAFSALRIAVPASALPGTHWISAGGRHSGLAAQTTFTVRTNWTLPGYGSQNKAYNPYENVINQNNVNQLELAWADNLNNGPLSGVTAYGGYLYVEAGSTLYEINALSGAQVHTANTALSLAVGATSAPIEAQGSVFALDQEYLYQYDPGTLSLSASLFVGFGTGEGMTAAGMTATDRVILAPSANDFWGILRLAADYTFPLAGPVADGEWYPVLGSTAVANVDGTQWFYMSCDTSIITSSQYVCGTSLYSYWATNGTPTITAEGSPAVAYGRVYAAGSMSGENVLVGLNEATGQPYWSVNLAGSGSSPAVAAGAVFIGAGNTVGAYDPRDGNTFWTQTLPGNVTSSVTYANGLLYVTDSTNTLYAFGVNQLVYAAQDFHGTVIGYPVVANGMVYLPASNGVLYAYALNAGNNAAYHRDTRPPALALLHPNLSLVPDAKQTFRSADEQ